MTLFTVSLDEIIVFSFTMMGIEDKREDDLPGPHIGHQLYLLKVQMCDNP